ncbi:MAG: hypothetical protein ACO1PI_15780 [Bacteroidota bacterium]
MTYRELIKKSGKDAVKELGVLLKIEDSLKNCEDRDEEKTLKRLKQQAYKNWQKTQNNFLKLMSYVIKNNISLDNEIDHPGNH